MQGHESQMALNDESQAQAAAAPLPGNAWSSARMRHGGD
jgi:hypothetical protein